MSKTAGQVKRKVYDLLPDTTSLISAKIILVVLQVFRKITDFKGYYKKIKKPLLEVVDDICDYKTFMEVDAEDIEEAIGNIPITATKEIQKACFNFLVKNGLEKNQMLRLNNSQHNDYKACQFRSSGSLTLGQSVGRSVNALRKGTSHHKTDIYYTLKQESIDKAKDVLEDYLNGDCDLKKAKKTFSQICK